MKPNNNHLPFLEQEDYVQHLLEQATQHALQHKTPVRRSLVSRYAAAACACLMLAFGGLWVYRSVHSQSPLDTYLASLSDAEAQSLFYYEIEEIQDEEY